MMGRLTKAQRETLEFIRDNEPVKLFPIGGPSLRMANKLASMGLVATQTPATGLGFLRHLLTEAGREALSKAKEGNDG